MLVDIAVINDDKTPQVATPTFSEEFRIMTSMGATARVFLNQEKAQTWMEEQRLKFGATAPSMKLVRRTTIQFDEELGNV